MTSLSQIEALLAPHMRRRRYRVGKTIHGPQKGSKTFYWIYSGEVKFSNVSESGEQLDMFVLGPQDSFGDISILSQLRPPHSATVTCDTEMGSVTGAVFRQLIDDEPHLRNWVLYRLATKLSSAYLLLDEVRAHGPHERVWRYLSWLAANGYSVDEKENEIRITQSELASRLGLSRATVSDVLRSLRTTGRIATGYKKIVLC